MVCYTVGYGYYYRTMKEEYTAQVAKHYNAYRPALHELILGLCLPEGAYFQTGLDIGCGTGQSALALTKYCTKVFGVEPSQHMLERALNHPKVEYHQLIDKNLPFPDKYFDVFTFAGSLFYTKSQQLLDELIRVSKNNATIIIYDFQIFFDELHTNILPEIAESDYDHETDFSGLNLKGLRKLSSLEQDTILETSANNIAHLLLSVNEQYLLFKEKYKTSTPYSLLVKDLDEHANTQHEGYPVKLYCTMYNYT